MSVLSELNEILDGMHIPVETGVFTAEVPFTYAVLTPLSDTFDLHADNKPQMDVQEVRISLYTKNSYTDIKNFLVRQLLQSGFTITDRRYLGFETETAYHHYAVDAAKEYEYDLEDK